MGIFDFREVINKIRKRMGIPVISNTGEMPAEFILGYNVYFRMGESFMSIMEFVKLIDDIGLTHEYLPQPVKDFNAFRLATQELSKNKFSIAGNQASLDVTEVVNSNDVVVRDVFRKVVEKSTAHYDKVITFTFVKNTGEMSFTLVPEYCGEFKYRNLAETAVFTDYPFFRDNYTSRHIGGYIRSIIHNIPNHKYMPGVFFLPQQYKEVIDKIYKMVIEINKVCIKRVYTQFDYSPIVNDPSEVNRTFHRYHHTFLEDVKKFNEKLKMMSKTSLSENDRMELKAELALLVEKKHTFSTMLQKNSTEVEGAVHDAQDGLTALMDKKISELEGESVSDDLTGLLYRKSWIKKVDAFYQQCMVDDKQTFCLFMLDIDYFKRLNDSYGHPAGDKVLRFLADGMVRFFNNADVLISRWGGEEFMGFLPRISLVEAARISEEFRTEMIDAEIPIFTNNGVAQTVKITFSAGIIEFNKESSLDDMIQKADKLLYQAKNYGRDRIELW